MTSAVDARALAEAALPSTAIMCSGLGGWAATVTAQELADLINEAVARAAPPPVASGYLLNAACVQALVAGAEERQLDRVTFGVMAPSDGPSYPSRYIALISESVDTLKASLLAPPSA